MLAMAHWVPSYKPLLGRLYIPWTVRSALPIYPFIFLAHCWVIWFSADLW